MKKTPVWQIVLLVVLLGVLAFAMFKAIAGSVAPRRTAETQQAPAATTAAATDMPERVPSSSKGPAGAGSKALLMAERENTNLFKVYQIQPQKNPFIQKEEWYADTIEQVPGYPELTEGDYFDSMDPYLPDLGYIMDNPGDWKSVSVKRSQENKYSVTGTSKDGLIQTQINFEKDIPTDATYGWQKGSKTPLAAMTNREWVRDQVRQGIQQSLPEEGTEASLFDESGLPLPGTMGTTTGEGDTFACYGVSAKGSKSSALILYNGSPRIVTPGMVLPTHYQVLEINRDGVVLVDVKTGFSVHVPLGGEPLAAPTE